MVLATDDREPVRDRCLNRVHLVLLCARPLAQSLAIGVPFQPLKEPEASSRLCRARLTALCRCFETSLSSRAAGPGFVALRVLGGLAARFKSATSRARAAARFRATGRVPG